MRATASGERPSAAKASSTCASFARSLSLGDTRRRLRRRAIRAEQCERPDRDDAADRRARDEEREEPERADRADRRARAPTAGCSVRPTTRAKRTRAHRGPSCAGAVRSAPIRPRNAPPRPRDRQAPRSERGAPRDRREHVHRDKHLRPSRATQLASPSLQPPRQPLAQERWARDEHGEVRRENRKTRFRRRKNRERTSSHERHLISTRDVLAQKRV